MNREGLRDLWLIGRSPKTDTRDTKTRKGRKQIGKFGIGKLAAYAVAHRLTYITKTEDDGILSVSINFNDLQDDPRDNGQTPGITLPVHRIATVSALEDSERLSHAMDEAGVSFKNLEKENSWTVAFLEDFKREKAKKLKIGLLKRVLSTAMPLKNEFSLYLNNDHIESSQSNYDTAAEFTIKEFAEEKLDSLRDATGEDWKLEDGTIVSSSFPSGISGEALITAEKTLTGKKSADLFRNHGFFVRARDRLINEDDPLFGIKTLTLKYFNRFRADIRADDLDKVLTAPREGVESSDLEELFQSLLRSIFNYARSLWKKWEQEQEDKSKTKKERKRNNVSPSLVEYPVADVLVSQTPGEAQSEADNSWFYLDLADADDEDKTVQSLYEEKINTDEERRKYKYTYDELDESKRIVKFNPEKSTFTINTKHGFVKEHYQDDSTLLLEDVVTAEALLEVYLRENGVPASVVGEVLERRDTLLRSLAFDHPYSIAAMGDELRDKADDQYDLEIALVSAARRLGFVAAHVSGSGKPDGIARFNDYNDGREVRIILEAKSSKEVPQLSSLDYAGLAEHMIREWSEHGGDEWKRLEGSSDGCLLVAPSYPGMSKGDDSAAAWRAEHLNISCWTIENLAKFVEGAEKNHLTARDLIDIVLNYFTPHSVSKAIDDLLTDRKNIGQTVYRAIIDELRSLEGRVPSKVRSTDMLLSRLIDRPRLGDLNPNQLRKAVSEIASSSRGGLVLRDGSNIVLNASVDEIERRVSHLTGRRGKPRRHSSFRENGE